MGSCREEATAVPRESCAASMRPGMLSLVTGLRESPGACNPVAVQGWQSVSRQIDDYSYVEGQ
jgi:hypothetical protein